MDDFLDGGIIASHMVTAKRGVNMTAEEREDFIRVYRQSAAEDKTTAVKTEDRFWRHDVTENKTGRKKK